jgi:hypothetical protein
MSGWNRHGSTLIALTCVLTIVLLSIANAGC